MIVLTLSRLAPQFQMESMAEEIKQLTEVSRAAVDTVNSMKAKTETVEADLKTLAHNIQGFTEEDLDDGDDDDNLHHQHAAPSSHHRRSSQVRHRSDDSSSAASVDRHAHEHDFGVFIGKLPAAAATDDSVRSLFTSHSGQVNKRRPSPSYVFICSWATSKCSLLLCPSTDATNPKRSARI
jgi:predicted phage gp36 major capsid-like protein